MWFSHYNIVKSLVPFIAMHAENVYWGDLLHQRKVTQVSRILQKRQKTYTCKRIYLKYYGFMVLGNAVEKMLHSSKVGKSLWCRFFQFCPNKDLLRDTVNHRQPKTCWARESNPLWLAADYHYEVVPQRYFCRAWNGNARVERTWLLMG